MLWRLHLGRVTEDIAEDSVSSDAGSDFCHFREFLHARVTRGRSRLFQSARLLNGRARQPPSPRRTRIERSRPSVLRSLKYQFVVPRKARRASPLPHRAKALQREPRFLQLHPRARSHHFIFFARSPRRCDKTHTPVFTDLARFVRLPLPPTPGLLLTGPHSRRELRGRSVGPVWVRGHKLAR